MVKTETIPASRKEIEAVIEASKTNPFVHIVFRIAVETGRRLGEITKLKVKDYNTISRSLYFKYCDYEAPLSKVTNDLLDSHIRHLDPEEEYLLKEISYRQLQNKVKDYAKIADIPYEFSFHNFREYFIRRNLQAGVSLKTVKKKAGLASFSAEVYDTDEVLEKRRKAGVSVQEALDIYEPGKLYVLDSLVEPPRKPGVYLLIDNKGKIFYIGISQDMWTRIRQHGRNGFLGRISKYGFIIEEDAEKRRHIESNLIFYCNPEENKQL